MGIIAKSCVLVRWPTQQSVPLNGGFNIYLDESFTSPINPSLIPAWPDEVASGKIGDGLGPDGSGADGFGSGGAGDGQGGDGLGMDGFGAAMLEYVTVLLADGLHKFDVVGVDAAGNPVSPTSGTQAEITLAGSPEPPGRPMADSYVQGTDTLTLSWALSGDDG
ncbi:MAG: hypothetical protein KAV00_10525 [Phycisphaerae bacterium]|nr:hypothetical protein [Phycisphaerae bacterium]